MKKISIISPCYNEEEMVDEFFASLFATLKPLSQYQFEIIIVNDGSTDHTLPKLLSYSKNDPRISVIDFTRNFGRDSALTAGLDHADCDAVILVDFDLQDPLSLIPDFLQKWEEGSEIVVGVRKDRSSDSFLKRHTAQLFYKTYNLFCSIKIPENAGDCRLLDRCVVEQLKHLPERQRFMRGLFSWVGAKCAYVYYVRQIRKFGTSKFPGWKMWNFALEGITSFSTLPLRIWTYIGLLISLSSFLYGLVIIFKTLTHRITTPGYSSLIVFMLFLGGIQIIGIGILGEYLGRIYNEVKQRPIYLVRKVIKKNDSNG